jgi:hypothetical protein
MMTKEVKTSNGTWVLKTPKAGKRNMALSSSFENGDINMIKFYIMLLPDCIAKRPVELDEDVPIQHILDDLEPDDYDVLLDELREMMDTIAKELKEKKKNLEKHIVIQNS